MSTQVLKISIKDAISKIADNKILLPAIQREFVWRRQAIEMMFDSILRGYPINTLMFWRISNVSKQPIDFYSFLDPNYIYGVTQNMQFRKEAANSDDRYIVIDGQQRLTSIYIGLYGTYQTEKGNPMYLCLRLDAKSTDEEKEYDFRFLKEQQLNKLLSQGQKWMKMKDLISKNPFSLFPELSTGNQFALDTITKLLTFLDNPEYLHYYDVSGYSSIDDVLEIFTRTNNTGTPLSKGDLLLSVLTTKWGNAENARDYVKGIIDVVKKAGYRIDRDWVFKCILVLFCDSLKLKVGNFSSTMKNGKSIPDLVFEERDKLKKSIIEGFNLIKVFGIVEKGLSSKLAVIPIVQFIYEKGQWNINKAVDGHLFLTKKGKDYRDDIQKWLFRAIVQNLFESGTDDILKKVKDIITTKGRKDYFPYNEIEKEYQDQLSNSAISINKLLSTQKVSAFPILNIIFCRKGIKMDESYDMDHTHPAVLFKDTSNRSFNSEADKRLAQDGETYNSVKNLQLLSESENRSKNKKLLKEWIENSDKPDEIKELHCIPNDVSLDLADFNSYIEKRSKLLEDQLKENLYL